MNSYGKLKAEALKKIKEYEGLDLYAIGKIEQNCSSYNHNYLTLPNKTVVLLQNDDDGWNDVYVCFGQHEILVGGQYDDSTFSIGEFT